MREMNHCEISLPRSSADEIFHQSMNRVYERVSTGTTSRAMDARKFCVVVDTKVGQFFFLVL